MASESFSSNKGLSHELLSVLVCPHDHGSLSYSEKEKKLSCKKCAHIFLIENGVPNMLK